MKRRDPRLDPRPGDIVESNTGPARQVVYVSPDVGESYRYGDDPVTIIYDTEHGNQKTCGLKTWRRWAKGARVVRRGPDLERLGNPLSLRLPSSISQQMLWFSNKYGDYIRQLERDSGIGCALNEDMAMAFLELGLVHALKCSTGAHALFKMVAHQIRTRHSYRLPATEVHEASCDMGVDCRCAASRGAEEVPEEVAARPDEHEA